MKAIMQSKVSGPQFLSSFTVPSAPMSIASTHLSKFSMAPQVQKPLSKKFILKLSKLLVPIQPSGDVGDPEDQIFGFRFNEWAKDNDKMFPVLNSVGTKHEFGDFVKLNIGKNNFTFSISRRAMNQHIHALMSLLRLKVGDFGKAKIFLKSKKYEVLSGIDTAEDLESSIHRLLGKKSKLIIKITL